MSLSDPTHVYHETAKLCRVKGRVGCRGANPFLILLDLMVQRGAQQHQTYVWRISGLREGCVWSTVGLCEKSGKSKGGTLGAPTFEKNVSWIDFVS